jgi:hypothetical protein
MTILIITHSQDNECIDYVMDAIIADSGKDYRFLAKMHLPEARDRNLHKIL